MSACFNSKVRSKLSAFTLVELLVVISIIALLLAILMPSLAKAREQAKSIVCASGMKQISLAYNTYGIDNDYKIPIAYRIMANDIDSRPWIWALLPYIDGDESKESTLEEPADLWFCPSDKDPYPLGFSPHADHKYTSYALNGYYKEASAGGGWTSAKPEVRFGPGGKYKLHQIKRASDCMFMMETSYYGQVYDMANPKLMQYQPDWQGHHRYTSGFYHNGGMNIMYVDGHVDNIKGKKAPLVNTPGSLQREGHMFWDELTLPDSSEDRAFWGPGY